MQQSIELRDLVLRTYEASASGDLTFYDRHLSNWDGVLIIGSDPNEWWAGHETIIQIFRAQMCEMGGVRVVDSDPQAYSAGDAGWVADRAKFRLPDGSEIPFRTTIVYLKEDGVWKIVQQHISVAVANQDVLGQQLTV